LPERKGGGRRLVFEHVMERKRKKKGDMEAEMKGGVDKNPFLKFSGGDPSKSARRTSNGNNRIIEQKLFLKILDVEVARRWGEKQHLKM